MKKVSNVLKTFLWRLRFLIATALFLPFIYFYSPILPYLPYCRYFERLEGNLSPRYVEEYTDRLHGFGVNNIHFAGTIFVPLRYWLGYDDRIVNAQGKAIHNLVEEDLGADVPLPEHIQAVVDATKDPDLGVISVHNCDLARAVIIDGW